MKNFLLSISFLCAGIAMGQTFIVVDEETNELIENVNYTLFKNNKELSMGTTMSNSVTSINPKDFDSISFRRVDYEIKGVRKQQLDSVVYLRKKIIYLDDVVIDKNADKHIVLGEKNRIIKSQARPFSNDLLFGVVHRNYTSANLNLTNVIIFVDKVWFKTNYKIKFFRIQEWEPKDGRQTLNVTDLAYSTDTLTLNPKDKGKIEIEIASGFYFPSGDKVFVAIELIDYKDNYGNTVQPPFDQLTKLSFQLSDKADFYAKLADFYTHELTTNLQNINLMTKYDFAKRFFKKPHKSIIVAPAILFYAKKVE